MLAELISLFSDENDTLVFLVELLLNIEYMFLQLFILILKLVYV